MIDSTRSIYDIKKGDLVVPISRSLKRTHKGGIGVVLKDPETVVGSEGVRWSYVIYWQSTGNTTTWDMAHGYLKRVGKEA